jgi:hypothetical protein
VVKLNKDVIDEYLAINWEKSMNSVAIEDSHTHKPLLVSDCDGLYYI